MSKEFLILSKIFFLKSKIFLYRVSENLKLMPKSCVVVG